MGAGQLITTLGSYFFTSTIMIMIKKTEIKMNTPLQNISPYKKNT